MSAPAIETPLMLQLNSQSSPKDPLVRMKAMFQPASQTYSIVSLVIEHPAQSITPTKIANMRLGTLRRDALRQSLGEHNIALQEHSPVKSYFRGSQGRTVAEKSKLNPSAEQLIVASIVYRLAKIVGDFPVLSVARCFALEHVDAKRWVALLKKGGAA